MRMRSFISIDIDDKTIVERIIAIEQLINRSGALLKLVEPENLHITLKFLGEIDIKDVQLIKMVIEKYAKNYEPFSISIKELGAFPTINSPRVIWVGIQENREKIIELAQKISSELEKLGFRKEERTFHPHITIARVKRYNSELKRILRENQEIDIGIIEVKSIKIKKSTLTSQGPIYTTLVEVPLGSQ